MLRHPGDPAATTAGRNPDRDSGSFLVRVWREPREDDRAAPIVRGYIRNLRTGADRYLATPEELLHQVMDALNSHTTAGGSTVTPGIGTATAAHTKTQGSQEPVTTPDRWFGTKEETP